MAALALGTTSGVVATSMLSGSRTSIFPITVFMWLMLSIVWARIVAPKSDQTQISSEKKSSIIPSSMNDEARLYRPNPRSRFQKRHFPEYPI
jgi:hypothetical protein